MADALVDVEGMRSTTYHAAWCLAADHPDRPLAASMAKAWCSDASRRVMAAGLQVHGGIGFTWDHDLHLLLKRAQLDATVSAPPPGTGSASPGCSNSGWPRASVPSEPGRVRAWRRPERPGEAWGAAATLTLGRPGGRADEPKGAHGLGVLHRSGVPGKARLDGRLRPRGGRAARPAVGRPHLPSPRRQAPQDRRPPQAAGARRRSCGRATSAPSSGARATAR